MRTKDNWPRCLSAMILKTRPENGAAASAGRGSASPGRGVVPPRAGRSRGGRRAAAPARAARRREAGRWRQAAHGRVGQSLRALVLGGGAGDDGDELDRDRALAERG